jgi:hypothetical protein
MTAITEGARWPAVPFTAPLVAASIVENTRIRRAGRPRWWPRAWTLVTPRECPPRLFSDTWRAIYPALRGSLNDTSQLALSGARNRAETGARRR